MAKGNKTELLAKNLKKFDETFSLIIAGIDDSSIKAELFTKYAELDTIIKANKEKMHITAELERSIAEAEAAKKAKAAAKKSK